MVFEGRGHCEQTPPRSSQPGGAQHTVKKVMPLGPGALGDLKVTGHWGPPGSGCKMPLQALHLCS